MTIDCQVFKKKVSGRTAGHFVAAAGQSVAAADEVVVTNFTTIEVHNKNDLCCALI